MSLNSTETRFLKMNMSKHWQKWRGGKKERERAFSLPELIVAGFLASMFTAVLLTALITARQTCTSVSTEQGLQQAANIVMNKIIKGGSEPGGTFRLSEATSYTIASISELHFTGTDGKERRYFLNGTGTELWYRCPAAGGGTSDQLVYRAPTGTALTLRFWPLAGATYTNITVGIDVGLARTVNGKNITGSATTMINIRNHAT